MVGRTGGVPCGVYAPGYSLLQAVIFLLLELHELHDFRSEISLPVIGCIALRSFGPVTLRSEPSVRYPGCSNPRRFVLGNFRSQDFSFPGTFVPNSDYS